jgi:hypothetical protein
MKIEDHVTNVEISTKLHRLGFKHKSFFVWKEISNNEMALFTSTEILFKENKKIIPAYLATELIDFMPHFINGYHLCIKKTDDTYICKYNYGDTSLTIHHGDVLANTLGSLLIFLLESGYIESFDKKLKD